jgi:hypothetical protein
VLTRAASDVAGRGLTCGSLICAASVFASWRLRDKSPASLSLVGKVIADFQLPIPNLDSIGRRQSAIENGVLDD